MSEELNHNQSNPDTSFEREDLSTRGVFAFMIGLAIVGLVIYFIIRGMYSFLDEYERKQNAANPLAPGSSAAARYIPYNPAHGDSVSQTFKENGTPMLEYDERGQFKDFLLKQEDQLNSYGWVDQQAGVAHIPIDRAMDLIVQRGLPVLPQGADAKAATSNNTATNKAAKGKAEPQ